ncbi:MAG: family 10 glycosylhydrolase, partial [Bacteroidota bacterium]
SIISLFTGLFIFILLGNAQNNLTPKREFRGAWIATVFNSDYPKRPSPLKIAHQEQYKNLLDKLKGVGINSVIVQVRPTGDALYPSDLVPWSAFLTGRQGKAPEPEYDLLKFMIEEAHKRSMEFHAWFNPFRATTNLDTSRLAVNHAFRRNRSWMVQYGNRFYFNPAIDAVKQHLIQVVMEVVANYDIDAVHFDDYFYPYKIEGQIYPDTSLFASYGQGFRDIGDWRRSHIDAFIEQLSSAIKSQKPQVKFGISPFGVWRNIEKDRRGSNTRAGVTTYDDLYADVLKWSRRGWIDYVIPQLYWNIGFGPADHEELLGWWSRNMADRHVYVGHAAYKVGDNAEVAWDDPTEIPRQIKLNRNNLNTLGSAFFSAKTLLRNRLGVRDSLDYYYARPALVPIMEDLADRTPNPPVLRKINKKRGNPRLLWKPNKKDINAEKLPTYYAIYRFKSDRVGELDDTNDNLLAVTPFHPDGLKYRYIDRTADPNEFYTYIVTALSRQHVESRPSNPKTIYKTENGVSKVR